MGNYSKTGTGNVRKGIIDFLKENNLPDLLPRDSEIYYKTTLDNTDTAIYYYTPEYEVCGLLPYVEKIKPYTLTLEQATNMRQGAIAKIANLKIKAKNIEEAMR